MVRKRLVITIQNPYVFREYCKSLLAELEPNFEVLVLINNWKVPNSLRTVLKEFSSRGNVHHRFVPASIPRIGHTKNPFLISQINENERFDIQLADFYAFPWSRWVTANLLKPGAKKISFYGATTMLAGLHFPTSEGHVAQRGLKAKIKHLMFLIETRGLVSVGFIVMFYVIGISQSLFNKILQKRVFNILDPEDSLYSWTELSFDGYDEALFTQPEEVKLFKSINNSISSSQVLMPGFQTVQFCSPSNFARNNRLLLLMSFDDSVNLSKLNRSHYARYISDFCREMNIGNISVRTHIGIGSLNRRVSIRILELIGLPYSFVSSDPPLCDFISLHVGAIGSPSSSIGFLRDIGKGGYVYCIDDEEFASHPRVGRLVEVIFRKGQIGVLARDGTSTKPVENVIHQFNVPRLSDHLVQIANSINVLP